MFLVFYGIKYAAAQHLEGHLLTRMAGIHWKIV